jgi:kynureninase
MKWSYSLGGGDDEPIIKDIPIEDVRQKSFRLTEYFRKLVDQLKIKSMKIITRK